MQSSNPLNPAAQESSGWSKELLADPKYQQKIKPILMEFYETEETFMKEMQAYSDMVNQYSNLLKPEDQQLYLHYISNLKKLIAAQPFLNETANAAREVIRRLDAKSSGTQTDEDRSAYSKALKILYDNVRKGLEPNNFTNYKDKIISHTKMYNSFIAFNNYLKKNSPDFLQAIQKDPRSSSKDAATFHIMPVQRGPRIPLLLEAVIKALPAESPEKQAMSHVNEKLREDLAKMNLAQGESPFTNLAMGRLAANAEKINNHLKKFLQDNPLAEKSNPEVMFAANRMQQVQQILTSMVALEKGQVENKIASIIKGAAENPQAIKKLSAYELALHNVMLKISKEAPNSALIMIKNKLIQIVIAQNDYKNALTALELNRVLAKVDVRNSLQKQDISSDLKTQQVASAQELKKLENEFIELNKQLFKDPLLATRAHTEVPKLATTALPPRPNQAATVNDRLSLRTPLTSAQTTQFAETIGMTQVKGMAENFITATDLSVTQSFTKMDNDAFAGEKQKLHNRIAMNNSVATPTITENLTISSQPRSELMKRPDMIGLIAKKWQSTPSTANHSEVVALEKTMNNLAALKTRSDTLSGLRSQLSSYHEDKQSLSSLLNNKAYMQLFTADQAKEVKATLENYVAQSKKDGATNPSASLDIKLKELQQQIHVEYQNMYKLDIALEQARHKAIMHNHINLVDKGSKLNELIQTELREGREFLEYRIAQIKDLPNTDKRVEPMADLKIALSLIEKAEGEIANINQKRSAQGKNPPILQNLHEVKATLENSGLAKHPVMKDQVTQFLKNYESIKVEMESERKSFDRRIARENYAAPKKVQGETPKQRFISKLTALDSMCNNIIANLEKQQSFVKGEHYLWNQKQLDAYRDVKKQIEIFSSNLVDINANKTQATFTSKPNEMYGNYPETLKQIQILLTSKNAALVSSQIPGVLDDMATDIKREIQAREIAAKDRMRASQNSTEEVKPKRLQQEIDRMNESIRNSPPKLRGR